MPKVTIWIRDVDYQIWQQIEDMPSWLHDTLQQQAKDWQGEYNNEKNYD